MKCFFSVVLAITVGSLVACANSPNAIGNMPPEQVASVTNKDLCWAFDHGQSTKPAVRDEVAKRRLNCSVVLLAAGLEPTGAAKAGVQAIPPSGDCASIEYMGVFVTESVLGLRGRFAKVRNRGTYTKIVEVTFFQDGQLKSARGEVKAGDIASIYLAVDDRPVTNVRLAGCE